MEFNLVDAPWLPCATAAGDRREVGLKEAIAKAHELRELRANSPLVTAALHRLLLAVLHRSLSGPSSLDAWVDLWKQGKFHDSRIGDYMGKWRGRFDLFDAEQPFYQVAGFEIDRKRPVTQLSPEFAGGNNPMLFDHTCDDEAPTLTPADCARRLVANQTFAVGGGKGATSAMFGEHPYLAHAPLVDGVTVFLLGQTLFETMMLNLLVYNDYTPFETREQDMPAWERDALKPGARTPTGYLDLLTWQSRCVRLVPDGNGVKYMSYAQGESLERASRPFDPMFFYRLKDDGEAASIRLDPERALWRDSDSLFGVTDVGGSRRKRRPLAFHQVSQLRNDYGVLEDRGLLRCMMLGIASDKAKILRWAHEELPVPASLLVDAEMVVRLEEGLKRSETAGRLLRYAFRRLAEGLLAFDKGAGAHKVDRTQAAELARSLGGEAAYWASMELPFKRFLADLPSKGGAAMSDWTYTVRNHTLTAFQQVAQKSLGSRARELRARVDAEGLLYGLLKKDGFSGEGGKS